MKVEFEFTGDDHWRCSRYMLVRHSSFWVNQASGFIMAGAFVFVLLFYMAKTDLVLALAAAAIGGVVGMLASYWQIKTKAMRIVAGAPGALGKYKIIIDDQGLIEMRSTNHSLNSWDSIQSINDCRDYIIVLLKSSASYVIPKRSFAGANDIQAFLEAARGYWGAVQNA